jgi:hypothetical protein
MRENIARIIGLLIFLAVNELNVIPGSNFIRAKDVISKICYAEVFETA